ncbi:MAG: DsrE family protein [Isosphaeraceae bacterium]
MKPRFRLSGKRLGLIIASIVVVGTMAALTARGNGREEDGKPLKVVVHVNFGDAGRQGNGLKNVENILKAAEGFGTSVAVEVVCHSDGIVLLEKSRTEHAGPVESLQKKGVRFAACENTMRQRSIRREDLLPAVTTVPSGAFEVVRRQQDGFSYFKP